MKKGSVDSARGRIFGNISCFGSELDLLKGGIILLVKQ